MTIFYGYEVSTEGDAFLVAFHEPFDAAAWCLCVQLALHCKWQCCAQILYCMTKATQAVVVFWFQGIRHWLESSRQEYSGC